MTYTKPQVIAQNASHGSYAAGCPTKDRGGQHPGSSGAERYCRQCELTA